MGLCCLVLAEAYLVSNSHADSCQACRINFNAWKRIQFTREE